MKDYYQTQKEIKEKIISIIAHDIKNILNPAYVKYTKENSMSAIDPSYIYPLITGGIRKPKLTNKMPQFSNKYDSIYEYGFDKNDRCLYRKMYESNGLIIIDEYYVYLDNVIYRIKVEDKDINKCRETNDYKKINDFNYLIFETYYFETNKVKKITERNEEYEWLNDDVAIIKNRLPKYLLIKEKEMVLAVFSIAYSKVNHQKFSYQSQGYVDFENYTLRTTNKLKHPDLDIVYSQINDINGKPTEYYELKLLDKKYIVYISYMKAPAGFSYKKAKEVYKKEILACIENKIKQQDFEVKTIGILTGNEGYSIVDPSIGFDKGNNNDVQSMSECIDYEFSLTNKEIIERLDDYIKVHGYYRAFHKLMISIKKEIEEKYQVNVVIDEIID